MMNTLAAYSLTLILVFAGGYPLLAETADSLRRVAAESKRVADSLHGEWDVLWKRSDSLRIESMIVRISSNILKREARA